MTEEHQNDLVDDALADEIELVSDLVVAASTSARHFTPDEVDALRGLVRSFPPRRLPTRATSSPEPGARQLLRGRDAPTWTSGERHARPVCVRVLTWP